MRENQKICKSIKESKVPVVNKNEAVPMPSASQRHASSVSVSYRQQTPEEQRQMEAALDVFLTEMVRQHLGAEKEHDPI